MKNKPKTCHYRRCFITDGKGTENAGAETLQSALLTASGAIRRPWLRRLGMGNAGEQLLTLLITKNSCTCGELVFYEKDRMIPLVDIKSDGSTWQATVIPNDETGTKRKFQEQSLYFAIRENHVALIQSPTLQSDGFQAFLSWLIQTQATMLTESFIALENVPAKSAMEKIKDRPIKGITLGDKLFTKVREEMSVEEQKLHPGKRKRFKHRIETSPKIVAILQSLGIAQPIIDNLTANPDPGAINVEVDIQYRSRTEKEGANLLKVLAATVGKQDGLETTIFLEGKSKITGDELKVCGTIEVQSDGGCIGADDALSKLSVWLMNQIKSGTMI